MAKPVDPTDPVVEEEESDPSQGKGIRVDLKEEEKDASKPAGTGGKPPATPPDPGAEERRWKALESQVAAARRINEDLKRQVQGLNERLTKPAAPVAGTGAQDLPKGTPQETIDKYDKLVEEGKWQESVRLLAREEYKASRELEQAQAQVQAVETRRLNALERSKQKVREAYPMLHEESGDPEAPETQLYYQAVAQLSKEDDQFLHDPYAPELAMHRMEQLAREQGASLKRTAPTTARALGRAGQTSLPVSRGSGGATTYQLSADQKAAADAMLGHLPESERYKHYARFAKMSETGGIEA